MKNKKNRGSWYQTSPAVPTVAPTTCCLIAIINKSLIVAPGDPQLLPRIYIRWVHAGWSAFFHFVAQTTMVMKKLIWC